MAINQALIELKAMLDAEIDEFIEEEKMPESNARLGELKTKMDAKIDEFLETAGLTGNTARLIELKAMLDAEIDSLQPSRRLPRTATERPDNHG
jgi:hypothetical protein